MCLATFRSGIMISNWVRREFLVYKHVNPNYFRYKMRLHYPVSVNKLYGWQSQSLSRKILNPSLQTTEQEISLLSSGWIV